MSQAHEEMDAPPPLADGALRVIPLGGLGAIGRNMTVFEYDGKLLIVDCGVLFPDVEQPGVDLILPDFSSIIDRLADVQAIVLTHGHEDHIGAVPYLLAHKPDIPLVGSQFTLALVEAKLAERRITPYTLTVTEGQTERIGPFECEFFAVNHSIPDALAVAIKTPAGIVLHTGDFKMDQLPLDGRITDLAGFARLGGEGVDLLLSDSTNAEVPGFVTPEREIGPVLDSIFAKAKGRIIVASFASHVHRVQQVMDSAQRHGRKVALIGRSMVRNMGIARDLGLLQIPNGLVVSLDEAMTLPPEQLRADVDGFAGRADERARPDGHRRPPAHHDRVRRHGRAGVVARTRQRDRGLPGHQPAVPGRRVRRAQGHREGARLRPLAGR